MVTVTSDPASPVSSGDDVTLTCTVELSTDLSSVSSVGVAITWTGPSGPLTSTSMPMMSGSSPPLIYTNTLLLSEVMTGGTYSCQAMTTSLLSYLLSSGSMSGDITISIGKVDHYNKKFIIVSYWTWIHKINEQERCNMVILSNVTKHIIRA